MAPVCEQVAAELLVTAARAAKCAPCGCAHGAVAAVDAAPDLPEDVRTAAAELRAHLTEERYECLGCRVCWPADALTRLADAGQLEVTASCPTDTVERRAGWPPLPGSYRVVRWGAPVAVCTLGDADLVDTLAASAGPETSIVGTLATENLGIERLVLNTIANPNIRFLIVAGTEPRQAVGHLPGASLVALARNGTDETGRIIDAPGRRPILANIDTDTIAKFRSVVEVIDLIGEHDATSIIRTAHQAAARNPGPAAPTEAPGRVAPLAGRVPARMTPDPAGYFVVYPDRARTLLTVEHYTNDGVLAAVVEGPTPAHVYMTAIDAGLLTRLDHAAYLGRELARAEAALAGTPYVQDAAPEGPTCDTSCTSSSCAPPASN